MQAQIHRNPEPIIDQAYKPNPTEFKIPKISTPEIILQLSQTINDESLKGHTFNSIKTQFSNEELITFFVNQRWTSYPLSGQPPTKSMRLQTKSDLCELIKLVSFALLLMQWNGEEWYQIVQKKMGNIRNDHDQVHVQNLSTSWHYQPFRRKF